MGWSFNLHRVFARLHGASISSGNSLGAEDGKLEIAYGEYTMAVCRANAALKSHGQRSKEFHEADVATMRLFHRVKSLQGLKNPRRK